MATFCAECGSPDLSEATAKPTVLFRLSGLAVYGLFGVIVAVVLGAALLSLFYRVDWDRLAHPVFSLLVMLGVLYWATTLLPGPVRKVGQSVGRRVWKAIRRRDRK